MTRHDDVGRAHAPLTGQQVGPEACGVTTKAGRPCGNQPVAGYSRCFTHEPALAEERKAARVRGGLMATHQRVLSAETPRAGLGSEEEARELLESTIHDVRIGAITPAIANKVFYGISVAVKLAELKLGAQLAELEQQLAAARRGRA